MHKKNTIILAAITSLWATPLAYAQDSGISFSGIYVGAHAGAIWGSSEYKTDPGCPPQPTDAVFCNANDPTSVNGVTIANSGSGKLSPGGPTGGIQAGYNWQKSNLVLGGEANFGAFDLNESATATGVFPSTFLGDSYVLRERVSANWLATLRGRLGAVIAPKLMLYTTAGIAFTQLEFTSTYADNASDATFPGGTGFGRKSNIKTGWTLGAGGEWLVSGPWSVTTEYSYTDFGSMKLGVATTNSLTYSQTMLVKTSLDTHSIRAGINYRF